jgi:hypothetical protein
MGLIRPSQFMSPFALFEAAEIPTRAPTNVPRQNTDSKAVIPTILRMERLAHEVSHYSRWLSLLLNLTRAAN